MKVGDRYCCIRDRICLGDIINKSGKNYKIIKSVGNIVYLNTESTEDNFLYYYNINVHKYHYILSNHFIELKENRRLKLKKIYENR